MWKSVESIRELGLCFASSASWEYTIVDEPGRSYAASNEGYWNGQGFRTGLGDRQGGIVWLQRIRSDNYRIVNADAASLQCFTHRLLYTGNSESRQPHPLGTTQAFKQRDSAVAFIGCEQCVARAHRQSIWFADSRANHYVNRQTQIAYHPLDNQRLLPIFCTEVGRIGRNGEKQSADHGGHSLEMSGPHLSFKTPRRPPYNHARGSARGIDGGCLRGKNPAHFPFIQELAICLELTRIAFKIFGGTKLCRIDEDRNGHGFTLSHCPGY